MDLNNLRDELSDLLASQTSSLAQHLSRAKPVLDAHTYRIWDDLQHLHEDTAQQARRLSVLFTRLRMTPRTRPFNVNVASYHDISLPVLVPLLLVEKREQAEALERAIAHAAGNATVVAELTALLEDVRRQVQKLESCVLRLHEDAARAG
jgi:hypothetical protein